MTKIRPVKVSYGINDARFDSEGRVIVAEYEKFFLVNSYIPNSSSGLRRLPFRLEWEKTFHIFLLDLDKIKPVIWCGDLNVAHTPIDVTHPERKNKCACFTKEERQCFSEVLQSGFIDTFRYLYPDLKEQFTYWSFFSNARERNVGWRLDYFVISERLKMNLVDHMIRRKIVGSDHCPIVLFLKFD
jgi:exodeoxyribonuclease-3